MYKILIILIAVAPLLACAPRTVYVPAQCQAPPEIAPLRPATVDPTLPVNELIRQIVLRYQECLQHDATLETALEVYK